MTGLSGVSLSETLTINMTSSPTSTAHTPSSTVSTGTSVTLGGRTSDSTTHKSFTTTTRRRIYSPSPSYPENDWEGVNLGVPVAICIIVVLLLLATVIIAKKRRGRLRGTGRQHPSRVMSGGPAMSVDAYRRYPGTVPHSQASQGQVLGQRNEVTLVVDPEPAPTYPGLREPPPSYEDVIKMYPNQPTMLGSSNLGYSHTSVQVDQPGGSTSQQSSTAPSEGESLQKTQNENELNDGQNTSNNSGNSENSSDQNNSEEKPVPEVCPDDKEPKPDKSTIVPRM